MNINNLINDKTIFLIDKKNKNEIMLDLIDKADFLGKINNKTEFTKAIRDREALISTGIGLGIAIPHAKIKSINDFFIITAVLKSQIDWDSIDQQPVKIVFLIGGPDNQQTQYLRILSQIMVVVKNEEKREIMFNTHNLKDIIDLF